MLKQYFYIQHKVLKDWKESVRNSNILIYSILTGICVLARAPVFSYVSASMQGMPTIRASGAETMVIKEFDTLQDQHTSSWFLLVATNESFGFYLDFIGALLLAVVTFQFLFTRNGKL